MLKNKIDYDCLHNYSDAIGWHYMFDRILFTQQDRMSIDAAMHFDQLLSFSVSALNLEQKTTLSQEAVGALNISPFDF